MRQDAEHRVVTFTANPSIDRTVVLDQALERGAVQRAASVTQQAAGKGVNVARVVQSAGRPVTAVAAATDPTFRALVELTPELAVRGVALPAGQRVRMNTTVTEPDGTTTKINEAGPLLTDAQLAQASDELVEAARGASWVALAGSLPPGAPADWYATLVEAIRPLGCKIAVDTSDAALDALLEHLPAAAFDLIKPNSDELAQLTGGDAAVFEEDAARGDLDAIVDAAERLRERGIANVLVTLGGSGAVLVTEEGAWRAEAPSVTLRSTVGAGDSSVAGFILADVAGEAPERCLASAVAHGSAAAGLPSTTLPTPADLPAGEISVARIR